MSEYIDREAAKKNFNRGHTVQSLCERGATTLGDVFALILDEVPAADVREVKRGKWSVHEIYKHEMSYGTTAYEPVYKCSACGNLMESYLRYDEPIMPEDADFPRFCPNCGADMRPQPPKEET